MTLFRFQYFLFVFFILLISVIIFCLLEIKEQYRYNYIQYQSASIKNVNILDYKLKNNFNLIKKNFFYKKNNNHLPSVNIYLSKNSLNYFKDEAPDSNKNWQRAILKKDEEEVGISIRPRGDNPANWALSKKSWKMKIRKKNFNGGTRTFLYVSPRINDNLGIDFYSSYLISKELGLLTPNIRFVELYLNGFNQGYYYEIEETDENFLRNNNMMPVNIYKGENYYVDFKIDIADNLFNNSALWTKKSNFNQRNRDNKDDLDLHLKKLKSFGNGSLDIDTLYEYFPLEKWAKEFLTGGNNHTTNFHNQRLMIDEWSGEATRVMHDPSDDQSVIKNKINIANDSVERIMGVDPLFNYTKFKYHNYYFKKNTILSKVAEKIRNQKEELINSIFNDFHYKYFSKIKSKEEINQRIEKYIDKLISSHQTINYDRDIDASWNVSNEKLNINLFDNLPVGNIKIIFKDEFNLKNINITLKTNNYFKEKQLIPVIYGRNEIILETVLLSDRIRKSEYEIKRIKCCQSHLISFRPTKFSFSFNTEIDFSLISEIYIKNIFTDKFQKINFSKKNANNMSSFNYAIVKNSKKIPAVFSGIISYKNNKNKNIIINEETVINPGTIFLLNKDMNIIFKNKVQFNGTSEKPIVFKATDQNEPWGTLAIIGQNAANSEVKHTKLEYGSGGKVNNYLFTGMFSIHNTKNINIQNLQLSRNKNFDDMMHVVYVDNLNIIDSHFLDSNADAIDIDSSKNVKIENIYIKNAGNDCLDFMQTIGFVKKSNFSSCLDKGISVGERSNIVIDGINIENSKTALVSKDNSSVSIAESSIISNELGLSAFKKNWRYGNGGKIKLSNIKFHNNKTNISTDKYSSIKIYE